MVLREHDRHALDHRLDQRVVALEELGLLIDLPLLVVEASGVADMVDTIQHPVGTSNKRLQVTILGVKRFWDATEIATLASSTAYDLYDLREPVAGIDHIAEEQSIRKDLQVARWKLAEAQVRTHSHKFD